MISKGRYGKSNMRQSTNEISLFETENIWRILLRIAPPVMLAQLIQALYNIVDSFFVGQYSKDGLTALSILFPIQLVIIAIAVGTGIGVNIKMSQHYAMGEVEKAHKTAGTGTFLAVFSWFLLSIFSIWLMRTYVMTSAESLEVIEFAVTYGNIVCVGSLGIFLESIWSKVHQASGNMKLPMIAQILGAITNILLDPILIFGWGPVQGMGIAGAAYATVAGQFVAAVITIGGFYKPPKLVEIYDYVKKIYLLGYPSIFMQMLYTVYIVALNVILAGFSDSAVTVLGLYYKVQSFFFIPLSGLQTCIVPLLSYTYAQKAYERCKRIMTNIVTLSMGLMLIGVACFELIPRQLLEIFTTDIEVLAIGEGAFRIIGLSFLPAVLSLMAPVFFQAIGAAIPSVVLSVTRQISCLIPIFWLLSKIGLNYTWWAFPIAEIVTGGLGVILYLRQLRYWQGITFKKSKHNIKMEF